VNRREFLAWGARSAAGLAFCPPARWLFAAAPGRRPDFSVPPSPTLPQIVFAKGDSPGAQARAAVGAIGGMGRFVARGDRVAVKPNISWDSPPELGADTHPEIVAAIVEMALGAGAREVVVFDHIIEEPRRCLAVSGIGPAAERAGARVVVQGARSFRDADVGGFVGRQPVMIPILEADKLISVPVVKQHGLSKLTASMKNLYGIVGGRRGKLHPKIDESIVDLAAFARPTLVVLDATRVMTRHGPSGGKPGDLIHPRIVAAGTDQVALDAWAASLLGLKPSDVGYIGLARSRGLGSADYGGLRTKEV
jgi:uncharacterized protein (DUF362 family)